MLRNLFAISLSFALSACNLSHDSSSPDSKKGSNPEGFSLVIESKSGYHAVKINDESWMKINSEITLSQLADKDRVQLVELCNPDDYFPRLRGFSIIDFAKDFLNTAKDNHVLEYTCDVSKNITWELNEKEAYLYSQQGDINIILGSISDSTINVGDDSIRIIGNSKFDMNSMLLIGHNPNENSYHSYREDNLTYKDGDNISVDFFDTHSEKAELSQNVESSDFVYRRVYKDDALALWLELSLNNNTQHLIIPEKHRRDGDIYIEQWFGQSKENGRAEASYWTYTKHPKQENPLEKIWEAIEQIHAHQPEESYGELVLPNHILFNENYYSPTTYQHYSDLPFPTWDNTQANRAILKATVLDLSTLPEVPPEFTIPLSDLRSTSLSIVLFNGPNNGDDKLLQIQRSFNAY